MTVEDDMNRVTERMGSNRYGKVERTYPTPDTCGHSPDGLNTCVDHDCPCAKGQRERDKAPMVEADADPVALQMVYPHQPEERPDDLVSRKAAILAVCAERSGMAHIAGMPYGTVTLEAACDAIRALPTAGQDKAEVDGLRAEVERLTISEDVSRASIDTLKHTYNQLFEAMQAEQADHKKTATERDALRAEVEEIAPLEEALRTTRREHRAAMADADTLRAEVAALRAQVEAMREALVVIADGRGVCGCCGARAVGPNGGVLQCDCPDPVWDHQDSEAIARAALSTPAAASPQGWMPIDTAPKDGRMVFLLVDYTDGAAPLDDAEIAATIGFNCLDDTGEDEWHLVGWNWSQDCFTDGQGTVIGWTDFSPPAPALPNADKEDV
ncbi:hypothetical protein [Paenirhodobacter populi]|uniref:Uncharacterized protein n=1 Tax=Paenirhodobacter populi TaxID=2306993 RepID=A0A443JE27_9RHOB|nr:hypothetical protein [Sinirhodobacter populi]RWR18827.1 hypothetical protein D2T30_15830 [Sinirhodobacter populi]